VSPPSGYHLPIVTDCPAGKATKTPELKTVQPGQLYSSAVYTSYSTVPLVGVGVGVVVFVGVKVTVGVLVGVELLVVVGVGVILVDVGVGVTPPGQLLVLGVTCGVLLGVLDGVALIGNLIFFILIV
jgi:hypothetical protein